MSDSDGEYVADDISDEDIGAHQVSTHGTRSSGPVRGAAGSGTRGGDTNAGTVRKRAAWEDIQRSWDTVVEGADGSINSTVEGLREAGKRKRLLRDTTPLQRGIIRHLILVLDLSFAMEDKDMRPSRYLLTLRFASEFATEYFEQNPISQLGIIGMRDGIAIRISDMSGNPTEHIERLKTLRDQQPQGNPSLQNALEMSRAALYHAPSHGTREVLIIYGALLSSDPGDIHQTIASLITDRIRVSVVGLAAQVAICDELCSKTNAGDDGNYNVALNEQHFRELVMAITTPPVTRTKKQSQSSLLMMGFPSRTFGTGKAMSFCACHSKLSRGGYLCSRCETKVCSLPAECPACGLTLILSTHLARSYHHLFPLRNWVEVAWVDAKKSKACYSCLTPFPEVPLWGSQNDGNGEVAGGLEVKGNSESGRYACEVCGNHFCIDCDVFAHDVAHNCPGCQCDTRGMIARDRHAGNHQVVAVGEDVVMG
ncbi:TFIIH basal transcription factor complex, subunit SSL1 [Venustampulla echinocandica]|uniref:General transcription and DNA repair factor IIH n=1 Tax=Venustampulla echinocandica TaxID=2656787 RepID=A0A370TRY7_9HELO|nr:TFIIH basal transcription factor complex, subunit SSL1 [Venustampulla echinocandica]RDL38264.1 TFIIH basal transcription factor complex, subunit SSL1 [Venustampulla echinocandica]